MQMFVGCYCFNCSVVCDKNQQETKLDLDFGCWFWRVFTNIFFRRKRKRKSQAKQFMLFIFGTNLGCHIHTTIIVPCKSATSKKRRSAINSNENTTWNHQRQKISSCIGRCDESSFIVIIMIVIQVYKIDVIGANIHNDIWKRMIQRARVLRASFAPNSLAHSVPIMSATRTNDERASEWVYVAFAAGAFNNSFVRSFPLI